MERVDYQTLLEGVADLAGLDRDNVSNAEFGTLRGFCSRRLKTAWEHQLWPEVHVCEERWFRPRWSKSGTYAGATLTTASEVFYPAANEYYQALRNPALDVLSLTRAGSTATVTFNSAHGLATGDLVEITGAGQVEYLGPASVTVLDLYTVTYSVSGAPATPATGTIVGRVHPVKADLGTVNNAYWATCATSYSGDVFVSGLVLAVGDVVFDPTLQRYQMCFVAHTTGRILTQTNFGVLTVFDRYVGYTQTGLSAIGTVLGAWASNPRVYVKGQAPTSADSVEWWLSENGVQVLTSTRKSVWLEYRVRPPNLKGVTWSSTGVYTGGFSQVYYSDAATPGNFYDCVTTTVAGESPITAPAKWSVVEIPRRFEQHLIYAATRDWLLSQGQAEKWALLKVDVNELLSDQVMILKGQSGQAERLVCGTR